MESFEKLKQALLIVNIRGDLRHRNDHAMERIPKGFLRWNTASRYLYDIERIVAELRTARSLVETMPDSSFLLSHGLTREDYAMYHQGYFLDLIHQLKDKQLQLVHAIISPDRDYSRKREASVDLQRVLKHKFAAKVPGLSALLNEWSEGHRGPIAVTLRKRTQYHHYQNPLPAAEDFLRAKNMQLLLKPDFVTHLNDFGREMITQRGNESFETWRADTLRKMGETLDAATKNIDAVSKALISYFQLPDAKNVQSRRVLGQLMGLDERAEIPASTKTVVDLDPDFRRIIENLREVLEFAMPDQFVALYLTGSITRPVDFMMSISDVNSVIVLKNPTPELRALVLNFVKTPARQFHIPIDTKVVGEEDFMSEKNAKLRFICKTDGVLIGGTDLLSYEKENRKCYKLVWLLNKDFKDQIAAAREWVTAQVHLGPSREYAQVARDITKRAFRIGFGQIIGNHTVYATSYKDMKRLMDFYTPENKETNRLSYKILTNPILIDREGITAMLDAYERNYFPLYDAIDKGVNGSKSLSGASRLGLEGVK